MLREELPLVGKMPEFAYGSVWLVNAGDRDPRHLSSLAAYALGTADAVIHDPEIPDEILNLVTPPRYREAAEPGRAIDRVIKLAEDGWRLVYLVTGDAMERAVECAESFAEHDVPFHILPGVDEAVIGAAPVGLVLVRRRLSGGGSDTGALVVLVAASPSALPVDAKRRQPPLSFSMSGLAG